MSKRKPSFSQPSYQVGGWRDWTSYWESNADYWKEAEERREFKQTLREEAAKEYVPMDVNISSLEKIPMFWKQRRVKVHLPPTSVKALNTPTAIKKIVEFSDKLPYNSDYIDGLMMSHYVNPSNEDFKMALKDEKNLTTVKGLINDYANGLVSHEKVREYFRIPSAEEKRANPYGKSEGGYKGGGKVGSLDSIHDKERYNKMLRIIQSRIKPRSHVMFEESMRKGKRINRNFINGSSYKPLMSKDVLQTKKKKLMIVYDCSGSMGCINHEGSAAYNAAPFIAAVVNSGVFEVEHVVYHSDSGWEDVARRLKKGEVFHLGGGSEGFEYIDDNLPEDWSRGVDYIIAITDLCIGSSAEQGLHNYLKKCKKHMVLSFQNSGTLKGMNVRQVKDMRGMLNALSSLVGTD